MSSVARKGLVAGLRGRINDERASVDALTLSVRNCDSATVELHQAFLRIEVRNGQKARSLQWSLQQPMYASVGLLVSALRQQPDYDVAVAESAVQDFPAGELVVEGGFGPCGRDTRQTLRHRVFSDAELSEYLSEAILIHNPNYTISSVPENEKPLVLLKAASRCYRTLAGDAVKRRGLGEDAAVLLSLARDLDAEYDSAVARNRRVIPVVKVEEGSIGAGEVIVGTIVRENLRFGTRAPIRSALAPDPPVLLDPVDGDVEDTNVRLRWSQNRAPDFVHYELWRDTQPQVERNYNLRLNIESQLSGNPQLPQQNQFTRAGTSVQVLGSNLSNNNTSNAFDGFFMWTASEVGGARVVNVTFNDGIVVPEPMNQSETQVSSLGTPLEPGTDYYYRLYLVNRNGEIVQSDILRVKTKELRARFKRDGRSLAGDALSVYQGPLAGGTEVTLKGTNLTGAKVSVGGKPATVVTNDGTTLVFTAPRFTNPEWIGRKLQVTLHSANGLIDVLQAGWTYQ